MPLPSEVHSPTADTGEKDFHIVQEGGKWCLKAKSTGKTLGCHDTKEEAEAQERAVQASKNAFEGEITVKQMREICPACADKMVKKSIKSMKLDFTKQFAGLSPQAVAGLCDHFGEAQGFRTRCMDSKDLPENMSDMGAFCNWLKEQCFGSVSSSEETEVREYELSDTHNIKGVEIFAAGEWNGDEYTEKDLDKIVQAFKDTKDELKPYLKLGHSEEQGLLAEDSLPAAGWIKNVYRKGRTLFADFCEMPKKIYDLVKAGAYKRVSSEIFVNVKVNGKKYPYALKAVALLGGETPAVQTLEDIHALYNVESAVRAYAKEAEVKTYEYDSAEYTTEGNMAEKDMLGKPTPEQTAVAEGKKPALEHAAPVAEPAKNPADEPQGDECYKQLQAAHGELAGLKKQMGLMVPEKKQLEEQLSQYKIDNEALTRTLSQVNRTLSESNESLASFETQVKKLEAEKRHAEVKTIIEKFVQDKKILPSQAPALEAILLKAKESSERKFKLGDKELDEEALIFQFVSSGGAGLSTAPQTDSGRSVAIPEDGRPTDQAVKEFMAKSGEKSYKKAYALVAKELADRQAR